MNRVIANIMLVALLLPSILWAQWDPTTVGTGTSVLVELNTAHDGSVDEDGANDAAEDADAVHTWQDQSGNSNDAVQSGDAGARLTYDIDGFGGADPCLQGASGDFMEFSNRALIRNKSGVTVATLLDYVDSGTFQGMFGAYTGDGAFNIRNSYVIDSSDQPYSQLRNPDSTNNDWFSNDPLTNGTEHVVIWRNDLANSEGSLWVDGTEVHTAVLSGTSNTSDTDSGANIYLFGTEAYTNTSRSCVAAFILWDEALSDSDIGTASTGLASNFSAAAAATPLRMLMGIGQ